MLNILLAAQRGRYRVLNREEGIECRSITITVQSSGVYRCIYHSVYSSNIRLSLFYRRIVNCPPPHIPEVSKPCQRILKALMHKNPEKRLGSQGATEIKLHPWFQVNAGHFVCLFVCLFTCCLLLLFCSVVSVCVCVE